MVKYIKIATYTYFQDHTSFYRTAFHCFVKKGTQASVNPCGVIRATWMVKEKLVYIDFSLLVFLNSSISFLFFFFLNSAAPMRERLREWYTSDISGVLGWWRCKRQLDRDHGQNKAAEVVDRVDSHGSTGHRLTALAAGWF